MVGSARLLATVGMVACLVASAAWAAPSCTEWMWQPDDGYYWKECVNDDGRQHCYIAHPGDKVATEVKCE